LATIPLILTADQAEASAQGFMRKHVRGRKLPTLAPTMQKFSRETSVHIYNVGPWYHWSFLGDWGRFMIPECKEGEPYSRMEPIPGIFVVPEIKDESSFTLTQIDGMDVAGEILGIGKNSAYSQSQVKIGAFIGSQRGPDAVPLPEELERASAILFQTFSELFEEAETASANGDKEGVIGDRHRLAARRLNRGDVKWMKTVSRGKMKSCPNCGTASEDAVVSCPTCTYVFDLDAFREMKSRLAANVEEPRRGPGRPPLVRSQE
jgi:hypothetical protein